MGSDEKLAVPKEARGCDNCRHRIDVKWTEKIICMSFLEVRQRVRDGECPEFVRQNDERATSQLGGTKEKPASES